jgi:protein gp37
MYKRFKWNPEIRFDNRAFLPLLKMPKGSKVFVGSTIELFGDWVGADEANYIMRQVRNFPNLTFIFLTKQPQNLIKWSPFPENCWVGVSATNYWQATDACGWLDNVDANVKFLSIEPLLAWSSDKLNTSAAKNWFSDLNWVIIGQQTPPSKKTAPKLEWIKEIVEAADKASVPVFLKNNLNNFRTYIPLYPLRQEFPK